MNYNDGTVTPINLATNTAGSAISVGQYPSGLVIVPLGGVSSGSTGGGDASGGSGSAGATGSSQSTASHVTVAATAPPPVSLAPTKPAVAIAVKLSAAASLTITLKNARSQTVATWIKHAGAGTSRLNLLLPPKARHAGHDTLTILPAGTKAARAKKLSVALRS